MVEVQDIFSRFGEAYRQSHKLPLHIYKAMSAIEKCRTASLGGHADTCDNCGYTKISYNSCRNRHCPKCQTLNKERWIEDRKADLLNIKYFHVVFTIPDTLNPVAYHNQKVVYDILFKAAAETLLELSADKKYLGAKLGFTSILHTWGQNLMFHPHIHSIVTGGGLNSCNKWVSTKKNYFIPIKVLSRKFRGKFLYYLKQAKLSFYGEHQYLHIESEFNSFLSKLYSKDWIVYCKPPFKNSGYVIDYLGRYTHRVAISNNRIVKFEDGKITFKYRDYRDSNKQKLMTVTAEEFIRRFLIHILPDRFMKIRHYGLLGNKNKTTKLKLCKKLTFTPNNPNPKEKLSPLQLLQKLTGKDFSICPCCGLGHLGRASPA
jgi:predicted Zn-ribbon and HTH transcriptional regulator